jgi:hypothetical protein
MFRVVILNDLSYSHTGEINKIKMIITKNYFVGSKDLGKTKMAS